MKAHTAQSLIDWAADDPFASIASYLTSGWVAEPKLDGCRAQLVIGAGGSRFGGNRSASFPALAGIAVPGLDGTVLDGEFLAPAVPGKSLLNMSAGLFNSGPAHAARVQATYGPARFCVFDVLAVAGTIVTGEPYDKRRGYLEQISEWISLTHPGSGVELVPQLPATAETIRRVLASGGEGVMLKRLDNRYEPGKRSWAWVKVKPFTTLDCFLTGEYKPGKNSRTGTVGAVEIAVTADGGGPLIVGHCAVPPAWVSDVTAADGSLRPGKAGTVIEVAAQGVSVNGLLRHPYLVRLRPDKTPADCGAAQLKLFPSVLRESPS